MGFHSVDPAVILCWPCLRGPHKWSVLPSVNALRQHACLLRPREVKRGSPRRVGDALAIKVRKLKAEGRSERAITIALKILRSTVNEVLAEKGAYKRELAKPARTSVKLRAARAAK